MKILQYALILGFLFVPQVSVSAEPPLAGHWKLDDKEGDAVSDSSGGKNDGKAVSQPGRTMGKIGGAFTFNGKDSYVEIPNSKDLEKINAGPYSVAAWFEPEIAPPGTEDT